MEPEFEIEALRLPSSAGLPDIASRNTPPHHKKGEHFLKGPIPWKWITTAARLPGKALHVGICIWYLAGMRRSKCVSLSMARLSELGVSRYAAYRGLRFLEQVALVRVIRHKGRLSKVELLDPA
jgi:hypothetical protein